MLASMNVDVSLVAAQPFTIRLPKDCRRSEGSGGRQSGPHRRAGAETSLVDFAALHLRARYRERLDDPAWSETLACADAPCAGTGRSRDRPFGNRRRSASGRRGAVADDARSREVRPRHSSWEADEQSDYGRGGAGGAKGGGQGECEPAKHAPDTVPGTCVTGAGAHTASPPSHTQGGSRVRGFRSRGSVRGAVSNDRPYRVFL